MACCLGLASCAAAPVRSAQSGAFNSTAELSAQVRAMAARQAELERKVERLEAELEVVRASPHKAKAGTSPASAAPAALVPSHLATVRLAPSPADAAPALSTDVALREPKEAELEALDGPEAQKELAGDEYGVALQAISTGDVPHGAMLLQSFADKHPRDERASTALFQAGLGLLTFGDPQAAMLAFDRVAQDYPQAREAPDAMMRLADCQVRMKRADRARDVYALVMSRYPGTPAARAAEAGLKGLADGKAAQ